MEMLGKIWLLENQPKFSKKEKTHNQKSIRTSTHMHVKVSKVEWVVRNYDRLLTFVTFTTVIDLILR
jgi:hypothetical protein